MTSENETLVSSDFAKIITKTVLVAPGWRDRLHRRNTNTNKPL